MTEAPLPPLDCYVIIPHPAEPMALMLPGEGGWALPRFSPMERFVAIVGHIGEAMREQLGIDVRVLRCAYSHESDRILRVYATDNHSPAWTPPDGARWVGPATLKRLTLAESEHRAVLERWFAEERDPPEWRVPWARLGWFRLAEDWIHAQLERLGLSATAPFEQLRAWTASCTLRVRTTGGDIYFKASPPAFAHEPHIARALADLYPALVPSILAIDTERGWMLMRDMGGTPLRQVADIARWEEALRTYAQLQVDCVERVDALLAAGCHDRRLDKLMRHIDPLLDNTAAMMPGRADGLSDAEIARLKGMAPRLKAMCAALAGCGIPHTLEHGDFGAGNIVAAEDGCIFYDWSDACVSHPFFSLINFLHETPQRILDVPRASERLRDAYLEPWTACAPMSRLLEAFELSQALGALHQAVDYHRYILPFTEAGSVWEMEPYMIDYLRLLARQAA